MPPRCSIQPLNDSSVARLRQATYLLQNRRSVLSLGNSTARRKFRSWKTRCARAGPGANRSSIL
jgi:hypothetical protein